MYWGSVEALLASTRRRHYEGQVQLIFTSPPFPLNRKKRYGNRLGEEYLAWLSGLAKDFASLLTKDGSIVMEIGNSWNAGKPTMSTLGLRALLRFMEAGQLNLCQQFICHNPARLPTPAQWVNIERIRVKDTFTHVWWMSPYDKPKASNVKVLKGYSRSMLGLLQAGTYNAGTRPSGHKIGDKSFLADNGGAIPSNVLTFANTSSSDEYRNYCLERNIDVHPARMSPGLAEFFVRMLSDKGDLVFDPFAGSNTTGAVAERLGRRWLCTEPLPEYVEGSRGRFPTARAGAAIELAG